MEKSRKGSTTSNSREKEEEEECNRQDRALCALQLAIVSGLLQDTGSAQEACLGLCNACRDGVPFELLRFGEGVGRARMAMVLPRAAKAPQIGVPTTRVLQPRKGLKVEYRFADHEQLSSSLRRSDQHHAETSFDNVDIHEVQWPKGAKSVSLILFNQCVARVVWPASMERLSLCSLGPIAGGFGPRFSNPLAGVFNRPLEGASFPAGLREVFLGNSFNQPIDRVAWPDRLERMSLPGFNQPLNGVRWPRGLKSLEFLPPAEIRLREDPDVTLEKLDFAARGFDQALNGAGIDLPRTLETLWRRCGSPTLADPLASSGPTGLSRWALAITFRRCFRRLSGHPPSGACAR